MKVGDLVVYDLGKVPASVPLGDFVRLGVVIKLSLYPAAYHPGDSAIPTVTIKWNGINHPMNHRQDILAVLSEAR